MKKFLHKLGFIWLVVAMVMVTLPPYPLFYFLIKSKSYKSAYKLRHYWSKLVIFSIGIRLNKVGKPSKDLGILIVSNHQSMLDILVLIAINKNPICFIAKSSLAEIPFLRIIFGTLDIAVDRTKPSSSAKGYLKAKEQLKNGINVVFFPEGGIYHPLGKLHPFKMGAFQLAQELHQQIQPITIQNSYLRLPDTETSYKPGKIDVTLHSLVLASTTSSKEVLKEKVFTQINIPLNESR